MSEDKETISDEKIAEKKEPWQSLFDDAEAQANEVIKNSEKAAEDVEANINEIEKSIEKRFAEE